MEESTSGERSVVKMGNNTSDETDLQHEGQLDPLTKAKNDRNKSESREDKSEDHEAGAIIEGANEGRQSNTDQNNMKEGEADNRNVNNNMEKNTGASAVQKKDGSYEIDGRKKEEDIIVMVASKDDVDAASTYSLFMEKDFRYYFQHPYSRLIIAYFVVFCNFLIYAEDPVAHSRKECLIPMIGNDVAFVCTRYPPNAWSLLKVVFWLIGIIIGLFVGKLLVHGLLFSKYRVQNLLN